MSVPVCSSQSAPSAFISPEDSEASYSAMESINFGTVNIKQKVKTENSDNKGTSTDSASGDEGNVKRLSCNEDQAENKSQPFLEDTIPCV